VQTQYHQSSGIVSETDRNRLLCFRSFSAKLPPTHTKTNKVYDKRQRRYTSPNWPEWLQKESSDQQVQDGLELVDCIVDGLTTSRAKYPVINYKDMWNTIHCLQQKLRSHSLHVCVNILTSNNEGLELLENDTLTGQPRQKMGNWRRIRRSSQTPSSLKYCGTYFREITQWWHWNFITSMGKYRRIFWVSIHTYLWEITSHMQT
jgi:hypothetical protein